MLNFSSHPKGLFVLAATEIWERASFYGLLSILMLFLTANISDGGLGLPKSTSFNILGLFAMSVYVLGIPGGLIADRWLGQKKTVFIGGLILIFGHGIMAMTSPWAIYAGLCIIAIGVGLLKPNISTMVSGLYAQKDSNNLDSGFTIFYMGINLGSLIGSLAVGYLAENWGWHWAFGFAGLGMIIGMLVLILGQKYLKGVGNQPSKEFIHAEPIFPIKRIEYKPLLLIGVALLVVLIFWGGFEQAKGLMSLYAEKRTRRMGIPTGMLQALNPAFILLFGGIVAWVWGKAKNLFAFPLFKMGLGTTIMGLGFIFMIGAEIEFQEIESSALYWLVFAYLFHTLGELCLSPVALSYITQVAPKRMTSSVMGVFFAVTGFGGMLAAQIGKSTDNYGELNIFIMLTIVPIIIGISLILISPKLKAWTNIK